MTIELHEIEPGVWIVPEFVDRVEARIDTQNYMWSIAVHMLLGGELLVRRGQADVDVIRRGPNAALWQVVYNDDTDLTTLAQNAASEVAAWIDARRTEPLKVVRQ